MQRSSGRTLAAVLFTDMVDSTAIAEELGDRRWKALVHEHHRIVRRAIKRFGGTELDTAGDGFFASFKEPASAIACACEATEAVRDLGVEIRAGIHFGECEHMGKKLGGITVVVGARIMSLGGAGDVLVSSTAAELSRGAGFGFADRGMQRLKGVEDEWHVFAATAVDGKPRPQPTDPAEARDRRDRIAPSDAPRRRGLVAIAVVVAVVAAALVIPAAVHRLQRGLPGIDAEAAGAVDPSNGHITAQVPLGDGPNGIAAGAGSVWVALDATDEVARIDPARGTVLQRISVQANPTGVAFGDDAVWVTNADARTVSWVDPASDKVVETIEVGNAPSAIAFGEGSVWVTNTLDGTVSKIDPTLGKVEATIPVGADPTGIAVGAGSVWVANQASDQVARIDPGTDAVRQTIDVGHGPNGITFDGTNVWVANGQSGTVMRIDPATNDVTGSVQTGGFPGQLAAGGGSIWVANTDSNGVARIDPGANEVTATTVVENTPRALAFDGEKVWVTTRASTASHQGGTLVAGTSEIPTTIDPNAQYDTLSYSILTNTNDGLLTFARVGGTAGSVLVPDLATTIPTPSDGGKTYTFDLRAGLRYSDGAPVKPSDVLSSFERAFTAGWYLAPTFYLRAVIGADACSETACDLSEGIVPDDESGTVTFHLSAPDPSFLNVLAMPFLSIVPSSTPPNLVTKAPFVAATGPFMISAYTKSGADTEDAGGIIELVRNPYFDEWSRVAQPAAYPEKIVIRFGVDLDRATDDAEQGLADVLLDTPPQDRTQEIRTRFAAQSHSHFQLSLGYFFLNTQIPPFSNRDARRALSYAVDRRAMAATVGAVPGFGAGGPATCQTLPPNIPGYAPYCPYTLNGSSSGDPDLREAQRLVDASGTKGARITVWSLPPFARAARSIASVLDELGYEATVKVIGDADAYFTYISDSSNRAQIGFAAWAMDFPNASNFFAPVLTCASFVPNNPDNFNPNYSEYCNPELDRQIEHAAKVGTTDPARANELWAQIDRHVVDEAPWIPFTTPTGSILVSERVGNVQINPVLGVLLGQMWVV